MKTDRTRIEFTNTQYSHVKRLSVNWQTSNKEYNGSDLGDLLEKVDKRLYSQWIDGCSIFELTDRQFKKFNSLLTTIKYT